MKKYNSLWITSTWIRAIKTTIQCLLAMLIIGYATNALSFAASLSVSGLAGLLSVINSLLGLPESNTDGEFEIDLTNPTKDIYRLNLNCDLANLKSKRTITLLVNPNASLSQK